MAENKGKPSGKYADTKKDAGRQGDLKNKSPVAGAKKKALSPSAGVKSVAGGPSKADKGSKVAKALARF